MRAGVFLATITATLVGCTPCLGVADCAEASSTAAVTGRLVRSESHWPVPGASIDLIVPGATGRDSVTVVTDAEGLFFARLPAAAAAKMSLRVRPFEAPGYVIDSLPCSPVRQADDACVLEPLVELPTLPTFVFFYRSTGAPAGGVTMRFVRTGGTELIDLNSARPKTEYTVSTDPTYGVGVVYPDGVFAASLDPLIVDMIAELPAPLGTMKRSGYRIQPNPWARDTVLFQPLGPALYYIVEFRDSVTHKPVEGVESWLVRLSGIQTLTDSVVSGSNLDGLSWLNLYPLANGSVQARLTMRARPNSPSVNVPLSLMTFDGDTVRKLSSWIVGATGTLYPQAPPPE